MPTNKSIPLLNRPSGERKADLPQALTAGALAVRAAIALDGAVGENALGAAEADFVDGGMLLLNATSDWSSLNTV